MVLGSNSNPSAFKAAQYQLSSQNLLPFHYYFVILIFHILLALFIFLLFLLSYIFFSAPLPSSPLSFYLSRGHYAPNLLRRSCPLLLPCLPFRTPVKVRGSSIREHCFREHRRVTVSRRPRVCLEVKLPHHVVILRFNFSFRLQHWFPERWCRFPLPPTAHQLSLS